MSNVTLEPDLAAAAVDPAARPPRRGLPRWLRLSVGGCLLAALGVVGCSGAALLALLASGILSGSNGNAEWTPAWSPDGHQIAFASDRDGNVDVFVMQADGTQVKQLTHDPFAELYYLRSSYDGQPAWSPAGDQIVFISGRDNGMMTYVNACVYRMQADGSQPKQLTIFGAGLLSRLVARWPKRRLYNTFAKIPKLGHPRHIWRLPSGFNRHIWRQIHLCLELAKVLL